MVVDGELCYCGAALVGSGTIRANDAVITGVLLRRSRRKMLTRGELRVDGQVHFSALSLRSAVG